MKKVIKQGKLPKDRSYRFKCPNCDTHFEAPPGEWQSVRPTIFAMHLAPTVSSICPLCSEKVIVNRNYYS